MEEKEESKEDRKNGKSKKKEKDDERKRKQGRNIDSQGESKLSHFLIAFLQTRNDKIISPRPNKRNLHRISLINCYK